MHKITPFLWFNGQAEEAMNFYVSIFKNSKAGKVRRYGEGGPVPAGTVIGELRTRRRAVSCVQRRTRLHFHAGDFVICRLPDAGRSRRVVGKTFRRRREKPLRLA